MKKVRNILVLALISFAVLSCDTDFLQDKINDHIEQNDKSDNRTGTSTGGNGDGSTEKDG